jgi:type VII secretion protein EccE
MQEDVVKARTLSVRASLPAVIAAEVIAVAAWVGLPPHRFGWWPAAVISAVAVVVLLVRVHRRNLPGWMGAAVRWRAQRRRAVPVAAATDIPHGSIVCGVRSDEHEAITMIAVAGQPYEPTLLRGSSVSLSTNVLPIDLLSGLLDQPGGLHLRGIDIVSAGHRVRRASGYPPLYSTLLADRPAAGQRSTYLIVRLDITGSAAALSYRASIGAAAAAATERIINTLLQEGIRATALSADELDDALAELGAGLLSAPTRPVDPDDRPADTGLTASEVPGAPRTPAAAEIGWRSVNTRQGYLTTYYFSPEDIGTVALNQMWSLRSDTVVQTISIWRARNTESGGGGPVLVSAMVRTCDPQRPPQPPTLHLNTLPGDQFAATLHPTPAARPQLEFAAGRLDEVAALQVPVGPTGIRVGAALHDDRDAEPPTHRDDLVMWALTDPLRASRITVDASEAYVRQLLIRAAAVGERIAIYSQQPARWASLTQPNIAVAERRHPLQFIPTIVVNDRPATPQSAGLSSTIITLGGGDPGADDPDLQILQTSESTVRFVTATRSLDLAIVWFRQEQAWMGLTA